jgi:cell wall-associated NlpC family hydrolase
MTKSQAQPTRFTPPAGSHTGRPAVRAVAAARRPLPSFVPAWAAFVALAAAIVLLALAGSAHAKTYTDVSAKHWAYGRIDWVTDQGPTGDRLLDDYGAGLFRPDRHITRAQLARAVVIASGHHGDQVDPIEIADVPTDHPYYHDIQVALKLGLMGGSDKGFFPGEAATAWQVDRAVLRAVRLKYPTVDWSMLGKLSPSTWEPNEGWKPNAPKYFAPEIAARYLGFRYNHPASADGQETNPGQPIDRDEVAYVLYSALHATTWRLGGLAAFNDVTFPPLTARQKEVAKFAFKYIGYPYVWGGEFPTKDSPYGAQAHGGFDCSGFVWYVLKIHFGYTINERVAADMARAAPRRITRANLVCGDIIFWGPNGPKSTAASIYHTGIYLGRGWFIHSTGSSDGVSLASLNWDGWSWKTDFAWGRRVLKKSQITVATAAMRSADLASPVFVPPLVPEIDARAELQFAR